MPTLILMLSALAVLPGCTIWRSQGVSPERALVADGPTSVKLVRASGDTRMLNDPLIEGDSVVGWVHVGRSMVRSAVTVLASCAAGWRVVPVSPMAIDSLGPKVRVTRQNGQRVVIDEPVIRGDSVAGTSDTGKVAVPLPDIARVAIPAAALASSESARRSSRRRCLVWKLTLVLHTLVMSAPLLAQQDSPLPSVVYQRAPLERFDAMPADTQPMRIRPTHWVEGGIIGGASLGTVGLLLGLAWCGYEGSDRPCLANALLGAALAGGAGLAIGALIGGLFPKNPKDRAVSATNPLLPDLGGGADGELVLVPNQGLAEEHRIRHKLVEPAFVAQTGGAEPQVGESDGRSDRARPRCRTLGRSVSARPSTQPARRGQRSGP
jgi:hypothetical protein